MTEDFWQNLLLEVQRKEAVSGKKIRLIFSDMDGTLLDANGDLPKDFNKMVGLLHDLGVFFVPASGRQHAALLRQLASFQEIRAFLSDNGTCLILDGEEIFLSTLSREAVFAILQAGKGIEDAVIALCTPDFAYVEKKWQIYEESMQKFFTRFMFVDDLEKTLLMEDIKVLKVSFFDHLHMAKERIYPFLTNLFDVQITLSGRSWVDVANMGVNKGKAAQILQERLGITKEESASFGDYLNDISLFAETLYAFAMQNAHEDVKKLADFIIPSNEEYGVIETIFKLCSLNLLGSKAP